ncbi:MAG: hypothetical protein IT206_09935 [Fimbriimonadaceae bacterium]|nr:hypothetical protein [Fimbriimonadaceae bacterium]
MRRAFGEPATATRALQSLQSAPLTLRPEYECFVVLPSNIEGVEAAMMLGAGISPFVAIVGPTGWGKSHLLRVAAEQAHFACGVRPKVRQGGNLIGKGRWDHPDPLLIDDAQLCLHRPRQFQALRKALDLRVRLGRATMVGFTGGKRSQVEVLLPQLERWSVAEIPVPHQHERQAILRLIAEKEGLVLSNRLIMILSRLVDGSGDALVGLIRRLGLIQADWIRFEDEMLALGIARPYMADPIRMIRWCNQVLDQITEPLGLEGNSHLTRSLAIFFLRKLMGIGESDVSQYYKVEPGDVFSYEHAFELALQDPKIQRLGQVCRAGLDQALHSF